MSADLDGRALVVLHTLEAALVCYDVASGRERFRIPTGPFPHDMCLASDRSRLYVTEYGVRTVESEGEGGNTVGIFTLRRPERAATIGLGRHRRPHGIALHSGGRLFVTSEPQRMLLILRVEDHTLLHAVDVGQEVPHVVAVSPDGRTAFTGNLGSGTVSAVDVMMGTVLRHVKGLGRPEAMACSPDGQLLYVVNRESAVVSIVDTVRLDVVGEIETGRGPTRVALSSDGRRLALALQHEDAVQIVDARTRTVSATIPIGRRPNGTALSADGRVLFVSCEDDREVYVVGLDESRVLTKIPTGEGPGALVSLDLAEVA
jgi:YVTN family beta-propeller protein